MTSEHRSAGVMSRTPVQAGLAGALASILLLVLERVVASDPSRLHRGYLFQPWSSNDFMQEVKINDLVQEGPDALWFLHVQPPMLEALRFLLVVPEWLSDATVSAHTIDERMYVLFALLFGVLVGVVYAWIKVVTQSIAWSIAGAVALALYPGSLAMVTLLDGTFLSSTLVTIMLFLLYLAIRRESSALLNWWLLSMVVVSLTRTIFQLQILIVIPVLVWWLYRTRVRNRSRAAVVVSVMLMAMLFVLPAKQFVLYGTTATTTFAGNHQVEVVSYRPSQAELDAVVVPQEYLDNAQEFVSGFNSPENVRTNYVLSKVGNAYYLSNPFQVVKNLIWGVQMNTAQAFKFTHEYSSIGTVQANRFVAALPWTPPMVNGLSVTFYLLVLGVAIASLLYAFGLRGVLSRLRRYWPMALVVGATVLTFLLANRYDWSEADRLKYIVEPFVLVVLVCALHAAANARRARRRPSVAGD